MNPRYEKQIKKGDDWNGILGIYVINEYAASILYDWIWKVDVENTASNN